MPARHPEIAYVRVALPLTAVADQARRVGANALIAFALAAPLAVLLAWLSSVVLSRRVQAIAAVAQRYSAGDLTRPSRDYGSDELGTVARVLDASVQDLGRRLEELARDRAHMEAILAGMVEGVLVLDRQGRVQLVNRAAQEMLAVNASAVGRRYLEVIRHPDISAQLTAALRGANVEPHELPLGRDMYPHFVARAAPVSAAGGGGAILVLHDITDLRRADQIRRDFVANVSHELRTPLTAIRGYVEALLDDPADPEQTRKFLEIVARHSARMDRLVNDLLRLARLDAHQEPLDIAPCALEQIFSSVVSDLGLAIAAKQQHVTTSVAPEACTISADPAKLHDIVRNLVENAVNYSPDRADIRVEALKRPEWRRRHYRDRFRSRHSDVRPRPGVRALLPRRQGAVAAGRHGSWPGHRAASRGAARRPCDRREPARGRRALYRDPARGLTRGQTEGQTRGQTEGQTEGQTREV